jgi:uncharacterized tannase-like protein DUF6351
MRWFPGRSLSIALLAAGLAVPLVAGPLLTTPAQASARLRITVLSGSPATVSGGNALVAVDGAGPGTRVRLNGRDVSRLFAVRADGRFSGLVTGLRPGRNDLRATAHHRGTARTTLVDHPLGGPIFAGPQIQPWDCDLQPEKTGLGAPVDAQCNTAPVTSFRYRSTAGGALQAYDPAHPPADVATTTTTAGRTVPFVVRLETGVLDRGIYRVAVLFDPSRPWTPFAPQPGWNGKVVWPFGGGSAPHHRTDLPVDVLDPTVLGQGYLVASSGLNVHGANANEVVSAEAVTMLKEHVVETYGPIRYTIGMGCSGGGIQQYVIANSYPGLLNGILPNCSFPDTWSTSSEVSDCGLLVRYFAATPGWTPAQQAAVAGTRDNTVCQYWNSAFVPVGTASLAANCGWEPGDPRVYSATNPRGVRCEAQDYEIAIWGRRPIRSAAEKAAGYGFARRASDNTGVLYGLSALRSGVITPAQFADLNAHIGGFDQDGTWEPARTVADPGSLAIAYRTGQVNTATRLSDVPIIDLRGSANTLDIHTDYHSWEMRARLDRAHGTHANQVIWTWRSSGNFVGITPPPAIASSALATMDAWLTAITADRSHRPLAAKIVSHKPSSAVDQCWPTLSGAPVVDPGYRGTCGTTFPYYGDARTAAGDRLSGLAVKCARVPLRASDVPQLSPSELESVRAALPGGRCDFSRRPPGYRPSVSWLTYAFGPGGVPLPGRRW